MSALLLVLLTQTGRGQRRVLRATIGTLEGGINGTLTIGRLAGNLLWGAKLYDIRIVGGDGEPFMRADSAFAEYNLSSLIGSQLEIERLVLFQPNLLLRRFPGDSLWNYEQIFRDSTAVPGQNSDRTTAINTLVLRDGTVRLLLPWEPDSTGSAAEQRAETREALAPESPLLVERGPRGLVRRFRFARLNGTVSSAFFPSPIGEGSYLRVDSLAADVYAYRQPLRVRALRGELAIRDSVVQIRAPLVRLPHSRLSLAGTILLSEGQPLDLVFRGDRVAWSDLQWLYPRLPEQGGGELLLYLERRADGRSLFRVPALDVAFPGTRLRGSFGVATGDTLRFTDVALRADPLRVETLEELLPEDLPVRGLFIGAVQVQGGGG